MNKKVKPIDKERFNEVIEDMGIHNLYAEIIWQWIEEQIKQARIDELRLLLTNTNVNQIKDEDILKRIKELSNDKV